MTLLLVGIVLTILMVFITRQLTSSLPPERFRSVIRLLLPAYLLLNLYFTLLMREPSEDRLVTLVPLRAYFAVLGWDIQSFPVVGQLLQGMWEYPIAFTFAPVIGIVQNLILFIPFGFLLCGATDQPRTSRILLLGLLLSLSIELCQLLFRLGWFEVDDILHNVLGTYLGIHERHRGGVPEQQQAVRHAGGDHQQAHHRTLCF